MLAGGLEEPWENMEASMESGEESRVVRVVENLLPPTSRLTQSDSLLLDILQVKHSVRR